MKLKLSMGRFFILCIFFTFMITILISILPFTTDHCDCLVKSQIDSSLSQSLYKLAVLVPFRDRFDELLEFIPHMDQFLKKQNIAHHIFILNQVDEFRFNRASLINVGFLYTSSEYDYIAMHDVDLLPLNDELSYAFPKDGPYHVASPQLHPRYHYPTFVGGILLINRNHFRKVNGMSNNYWGWGLEDDEFYVRLKEAGLNVTRPQNISTGIEDTFLHIHDKNKRRRDMKKCFNQQEVTRRRDRRTGLADVSYQVPSIRPLTISGASATVVNVRLVCNRTTTPWCSCDDPTSSVTSRGGTSPTKRLPGS